MCVVVEAMWRFLNGWPGRPGPVGLGCLGKEVGAAALVPMGAQEAARRFVDGSAQVRWPFLVEVRAAGGETRARIEAMGALEDLGRWMAGAIGGVDLGPGRRALYVAEAALPEMSEVEERGAEVYRGAYVLVYQEDGADN